MAQALQSALNARASPFKTGGIQKFVTREIPNGAAMRLNRNVPLGLHTIAL